MMQWPELAPACAVGMTLTVMLMDASGDHSLIDIDALPTADGDYQALIPIGEAHYAAGIQLGRMGDWVRIRQASFHDAEAFPQFEDEREGLPASLILEAMEEIAPGLYRCTGDDAFIVVPPPDIARPGKAMLLRLLFRPVSRRHEVASVHKAAPGPLHRP